ncbi:MAG: SGNH/GDSL hydrolase family protein [Pseudomonadota bacterium]
MNKSLKNILLFCGSILFCLYFSEWLLGFYLTKAMLHFPVSPYSEHRHTTIDYSVTYRYNNYGFRGPDYFPSTVYDIVFLGDSFFFGQGVREGKTFPDLLQSRGFYVLNASEIATNPIDYFHKLRILYSHRLQAGHIIVGLCIGNDFQDIGDKRISETLSHAYRPEFLRYDWFCFLQLERLCYQIRTKWIQFNDWFNGIYYGSPYPETVVVHDFELRKKSSSDWLQFFADNRKDIMEGMKEAGLKPFTDIHITEDEYLRKLQINNASLDKTIMILNAVRNISDPIPVTILLIPGPHYAYGFRSVRYSDFLEKLTKTLSASVRVIDLHGLTTAEMYYLHDGHWNEKGHQFVADVIIRHVRSQP